MLRIGPYFDAVMMFTENSLLRMMTGLPVQNTTNRIVDNQLQFANNPRQYNEQRDAQSRFCRVAQFDGVYNVCCGIQIYAESNCIQRNPTKVNISRLVVAPLSVSVYGVQGNK